MHQWVERGHVSRSGEEGGLRIVRKWSSVAQCGCTWSPTMASSCVSPWSCVHPRQSPVPWTVLRHCRLPRDQEGAVCTPALLELCQSLAVKGLAERWLVDEVVVVAFILSC